MAISPIATYPTKVDGTVPGQYPYGRAQNITVPGDATGTPWEQALVNDIFGFQQKLLDFSSIVPSGTPDNIINSDYFDALSFVIKALSPFKGVYTGLTVSNHVSDTNLHIEFNIGVAGGQSISNIIELTSPLVKHIESAWAAGTGVGGLFSGAVAASTTYHLFVIKNTSTGDVDAGFDTDINAANRPVAYDEYARVASLKTDGSGNLYQFIQDGDTFWIQTPIVVSSGGTSGATFNILVDAQTPHGIGGEAIISHYHLFTDTTQESCVGALRGVGSPDIAIAAIFDYSLNTGVGIAQPEHRAAAIRTNVPLQNNLSQFRFRTDNSTASRIDTYSIKTLGWTDNRGKV
jgi:hypothetical protein